MSKPRKDRRAAGPAGPTGHLAHIGQQGSTRATAAVVAIFAVVVIAGDAAAIESEFTLGVGPGYTDLPTRGASGQQGFGGGLYGEYRFSDYFGVTAGAYTSYQLSVSEDELPGVGIDSVWFGGLYNIDVATYVPFVSLSLTGYFADPEDQLADDEGNAADLGVRAGLGVDYRRHRHWSFGVEGNFHAFLTDLQNYPVYITTLVRLNFHFEL